MSNIEEVVIDIIKQNLETINQSKQIRLDDKLADLGINSLSFIKIVVNIESKYGFEFDDEDLIVKNFLTVNDLVNYISTKI